MLNVYYYMHFSDLTHSLKTKAFNSVKNVIGY